MFSICLATASTFIALLIEMEMENYCILAPGHRPGLRRMAVEELYIDELSIDELFAQGLLQARSGIS